MENASSLLRGELDSFAETHQLTPREQDVVYLLLCGTATVQRIAETLGLSQNTIHNHFKSIFRRTKTNSKAALLALFIEQAMTHQAQMIPFVRRPEVLLVDVADVSGGEAGGLSAALQRRGMRALELDNVSVVADEVIQRADAVVAQARSGPTGAELTESLLGRNAGGTAIFIVGDADEAAQKAWRAAGVTEIFARDVASDEVVFAVLEKVIQSSYDHNRLVRVDTELKANVDRRFTAGIDNIGFGGAFLSLADEELTSTGPLRVGRRVHLEFELGSTAGMGVEGEVLWLRNRSRPAKPAGVGVRFLDLSESQRQQLQSYVRRSKLQTLAPWDSQPARPAPVGC